MTVNIRIFRPTGYSFGTATLSRVNDVLAIDFDSSRNIAIHLKHGIFRAEISLMEAPTARDWILTELIQGGSQGYSWNISDKIFYGVVKWIRFTLKDKSMQEPQPGDTEFIPTIQWRNIKNCRIVSSESVLEVLDTAPRTLQLNANSNEEYSLENVVSAVWFNGDDLTTYSVSSSDESVVRAVIVNDYLYPRDQRGTRPDRIRIAARNLTGRQATVEVVAEDVAGNTAILEIEVSVI